MIKDRPVLTIHKTDKPWLVRLQFPYNAALITAIKGGSPTYPGAIYAPLTKQWTIPVEHVTSVCKAAITAGLALSLASEYASKPQEEVANLNPRLYPFQVETAKRAVKENRLLINFSMGLGKTATALEVLKHTKPERTLVVCPAMARMTWTREATKWLGLPTSSLTTGEKAASYDGAPGLVVTSYGLVSKLPKTKWDTIIYDECHYLAYSDSQRSKASRGLLAGQHDVPVMALTGTPLTNNVESLWNQLDTLWPKRFGTITGNGRTPWAFMNRYMNAQIGAYGTTFRGVRAEYLSELRDRLAAVSARVSKSDVLHLLPQLGPATLVERLIEPSAWREYQESLECQGVTHYCYLTHLRETAHAVAGHLAGKAPVYIITGELTPEARFEMLEKAASDPEAIIVATLDSVRESIDMTFCQGVTYVELPQTPLQMIQSLGRFHRLSGKHNISVTLMASPGEYSAAEKLADKIDAVNSLIRPGSEEKVSGEVLGQIREANKMSMDELTEFLASVDESFGMGW